MKNGGQVNDPTTKQGTTTSFDASSIDHIPSEIEYLMQGILKTRKNRANASYTILVVVETSVAKPSLSEVTPNVLDGNDTGHYNLDTPTNEVVLTTRVGPTPPAFTNLQATTIQ